MGEEKVPIHAPLVSVIVPFSKPDLAEVVIEKLMQQTYPSDMTEILLVGPKSNSLGSRWPITAVETKSIYYPGEARNIGARAATGQYFLFLDDDCEPALNWIEQNVRELNKPEVGAVGGQIAGKSKAFFAQCVDFSRFGFSQVNTASEGVLCSASLGVKRKAFEEAKGFSEVLRSEEDMDFCYRLIKMGYKTVYQPLIKVLHDHRRNSFSVLMRYSYFYGRVSGLYVKRLYPGMSTRNSILTRIQNPILYPFMMFPVSLGATLNIVRVNIREYPRVLLYAPFIFLSKVASHIGIWQWLLQGHPVEPISNKQ
jgi:GT2 family glycosyltransferase